MITSPAGQALQEELRQVFLALRELDKVNSHEVAQIVAATLSTIRNWKPQALLAAGVPALPSEAL